jgi:tetratricopeptide (TPR) repeat protein
VAIDREATLRKAEKFLRQGRLDNAIAEYLHVVEENPRDWNTVNALGDLLVRAGQIESANEHYVRIADHLFEEGFLPRAAAVYKKILKLRPDMEHALLRTAEIFEKQGLVADAKAALGNVAERRVKRGDRRGAAEINLRIGTLDPSDLVAGMAAARAAGELGDAAGALERLIKLASDFQERGKFTESLQALDEAIRLDPDNAEVRAALVNGLIQAGELTAPPPRPPRLASTRRSPPNSTRGGAPSRRSRCSSGRSRRTRRTTKPVDSWSVPSSGAGSWTAPATGCRATWTTPTCC